MGLTTWFAFAAASIVLLLIPGPTVLLVVSYALTQGRRVAVAMAAGVALGDFTAMTLSLAGLGALLLTSAGAFTILKWIGAAYLVYLGIRLWRSEPELPDVEKTAPAPTRAIFGHAFVVTALNPKSIAFFVAFVPQFIVPTAPLLPQMLLLGGTFLALATLNAAAYAILAGSARDAVRHPAINRAVHRTGGGMLIGAGLWVAPKRAA